MDQPGLVSRVKAPHGTLLVAALLTLAACAQSGDGVAPSNTALRSDNPWGIVAPDVPTFQLEILSDNELSRGEYDRAVFAMIECMRSAGIWVSDPVYEFGQYSFVYGGNQSLEAQDAAEAKYDECYAEYVEIVDWAWFEQNRPSEEEVQLIRDRIGSCLRGKGFEISQHPSNVEIGSVLELGGMAARDCMESY
jgi:hypothetical protein